MTPDRLLDEKSKATYAVARAVDLARATCTRVDWQYLAEQAGQLGPLLRRAAKGQARLWKWPLIVAVRLPAAAAALAALHLVAAGMLAGVLRRVVPFAVGWVYVACLVAVVVFVGVIAAPPGPARADNRWWSEGNLLAALQRAKVVPVPRKDDPAPHVRRLGAPQHGARGVTVKVALPHGVHADVVKAHDHVAAGLGVCASRLLVDHDPADPPHVLALTVLDGAAPARQPAVDEGRWADGVEIGTDPAGRPHTFQAKNTHSVIAGASGSGKTASARLVVGAAALDEDVRLWLVDAKGDAGAAGWEALVPRCEKALIGVGPDDAPAVEELLQEVVNVATARGRAGNSRPEVVLVVEEIAALRAVVEGADKRAWQRIDRLLTVLLSTSRSRGVHCIVISQRGTVDSVPPIVRANSSQRLVGLFADSKETGYVLEGLPPVLPSRPGEFLLRNDRTTSATIVQVDHLGDDAWERLCARATSLRAARAPETTEARTEPHSPSPDRSTPEALSAVQAAAFELLTVEADGLPADLLRALLPEDVRPANAARLGRELSSRPDRFAATRDRDGRRWVAVTPSSAPVTDPRPERGDSRNDPHMRPAPPLPSRLPSRADLDRQENSS